MKILEIENALNFCDKLTNDINNSFHQLLLFLREFNEIYLIEEDKLPYHINLIDELHASENAHSRILSKLLQQQEPINKKFQVLESFLKYIVQKYNDKDDFSKIKIKNPIITEEIRRIDLWIRDNDYAIIIENKVGWAGDQKNQLERYIEITKEYKFKEEQIYILYLPPTNEKEPEIQTWGKYYENDIRYKRYLKLTFMYDILPWLKKDIALNIREKDRFLSSSIEQYIDHLEGLFSLREINNNMNMNLKNFIKVKLEINDIEPEIALKIISEKLQEMENATNQLNSIKKELEAEIDEKYYSNCYEELKDLNLNVIRKIDCFLDYYPNSVGVKMNNKMTVWIGNIEGNDSKLFCQVNFDDMKRKIPQKIKQKFEEILQEEEIEYNKDGLEIWARIENRENALIYLKEICAKMNII